MRTKNVFVNWLIPLLVFGGLTTSILTNVKNRPEQRKPDCVHPVQLDTSIQYYVDLPAGSGTAPCAAYECGSGFEWYGAFTLPAGGSWRIKSSTAADADADVCITLLKDCDSVCQATTIPAGGRREIDWKAAEANRWIVHLASGTSVTCTLELGRYELGPECYPSFWGDPCDN